jgi:UDP-glucose 4-epimerase
MIFIAGVAGLKSVGKFVENPLRYYDNNISGTITKEVLQWKATKKLKDMCIDSWRWQSNNHDGYEG